MENLKRSIRYQLAESKDFLFGFWATVLILNILFYIFSYIGGTAVNIGISVQISSGFDTLVSVAGANLMIILITLIVYNYQRNYGSFPLAISLNMTRKNYFASFLIDNIFMAFMLATIQGFLMKIDPFFVKLIGRNPLYNFTYFNIQTDNVFYIIFILFVLFLTFICFWNLMASLNYKFGYKIWIIAVAINMVVSISGMSIVDKVVKSIGRIFTPRLGLLQLAIIFLGISISYIINYFIVTRTDIKGKIG